MTQRPSHFQQLAALALAGALLFSIAGLRAQQTPPPPQEGGYRIKVTAELVLVNVVVRNKKGNLIHGLKREDFTLLEDGRKQDISTFDVENVDDFAVAGSADATVSGAAADAGVLKPGAATAVSARDRRLLLFFFDFSAMDPEQIDRSIAAAQKFVQTKMQAADMVALASLATNVRIDLDFTDDKARLLAALKAYASGQGQGFDNGGTGSSEGAAETGGAFTADDSDYNTFNADRKLLALQSLMKPLGGLPQKKSIIYFSNGITQSGIDNQSTLRATTAAAIKANVAIYSLDIRGLDALPPGGEAQAASLHGRAAYSGASVLSQLDSALSSQETLATLSSDTGGKAFFDSNDFAGIFSQAQKDSSSYYVLGFRSFNSAKDGRFRHLKVQLNRPDVKLDYRSGYYAGRDFEHLNRAGREQQLEDELASESPQTDISVYAGAAYFRQDDSHYFLGVSLVIPGSQIPFVQEKDRDNATVDFIGAVREGGKFQVGQQRDTVKLAVDASQQVRRKNMQYNTGFVLAPGNYRLKFVVRENRTGRMGSFETNIQIPDLRKSPLKMSSVVLAGQRVPASGKKSGANPLVREQTELIPSVTHVFTQDQHLYLQYEIYDAAKGKQREAATPPVDRSAGNSTPPQPAKPRRDSVRVLTSIEFLQGASKIYESKPIVATEVTAPDRKAVIFQIDLPLQSLQPGFYTCQINVIDDVAGNYAFPRWPILIKPSRPASPGAALATGF